MKGYGKELILDIHECDVSKFNKKDIKKYLVELCKLIDMEREDLHWWEFNDLTKEEYDALPPHLKGISCVQFIRTSNIVIHTLEELKCVFINIFSCKNFKAEDAYKYTKEFFSGKIVSKTCLYRK
jgi:S-adenosylmethionine/arginine decarboxylase-like enzyme